MGRIVREVSKVLHPALNVKHVIFQNLYTITDNKYLKYDLCSFFPDINDNAITFLNPDTEMRYANIENAPKNDVNPLQQNITFAFRTRSLQALLLFTKDHIQNLMQIYLAKPNELSVIWNTGYTLRNMAISSGDICK